MARTRAKVRTSVMAKAKANAGKLEWQAENHPCMHRFWVVLYLPFQFACITLPAHGFGPRP